MAGETYAFVSTETAASQAQFQVLGCAGPFQVVQSSEVNVTQAVFLRLASAPQTLYRCEAARQAVVQTAVNVNVTVAATALMPVPVVPAPAVPVGIGPCTGNPGVLGANGLPQALPQIVAFSGSTYAFVDQQTAAAGAQLKQIGCAGAFEVVQSSSVQVSQAIYLRLASAPQTLYRCAATTKVTVQTVTNVQVTVAPTQIVVVQLTAPATAQPGPTPVPTVAPVATVTTATAQAAAPAAVPCAGTAGPVGANGLPQGLPRSISLGSQVYVFVGPGTSVQVGTLTTIGCVGPFVAAKSSQANPGQVLYLRLQVTTQAGEIVLYRYEARTTYQIQVQVSGNPQILVAGNQQYGLTARWSRSIYSSVSVILYAANPNVATPPLIYAQAVGSQVIAQYAPPGEITTPPPGLLSAAQAAGINPDLTLQGKRYILMALWTPTGVSADGWVTLYAPTGTAQPPDTLIATDPRILDLLIYERSR